MLLKHNSLRLRHFWHGWTLRLTGKLSTPAWQLAKIRVKRTNKQHESTN